MSLWRRRQEKIASQCPDLDVEQAVICGLLHDIGRRYGVTYLAHVYDGYRYLMELGDGKEPPE